LVQAARARAGLYTDVHDAKNISEVMKPGFYFSLKSYSFSSLLAALPVKRGLDQKKEIFTCFRMSYNQEK
jgi:hypothetical protein